MPIVQTVVQQHVDDAAVLYGCRSALCAAPHSALRDLRRFDDRLIAHLDGLSIAGDEGWPFCEAALHTPSAGALFINAVRVIQERRERGLDRVLAIAQAMPETRQGVLAAFGWLDPQHLEGMVARLLASEEAFSRLVGIAACAVHRVDPGMALGRWLHDHSPLVRARAIRAAGELGRHDLMPACLAALTDDDPDCRLWAAWSAALLGNRGVALEALTARDIAPEPWQTRAFRLALQAMSVRASHTALEDRGREPGSLRWLIQGSGIAGDPGYVPWLIKHMGNETTARLAGEAFSLITGADLALQDLERKPPKTFESGPTIDPDDLNVQMDPDEGLPWPDPERIEKWWSANGGRLRAGTRCFMGAPVTREHCIGVLKNGYQRQRILAAHYLCILQPGIPLFNTSAPAWRQQRLLAQMQ